MKSKNHFWKGALVGALTMLFIVFWVVSGFFVVRAVFVGDRAVDGDTEGKLRVIQRLIDDHFLYSEDVSEDALQESMIKGYVDGLGDMYSVYYNEEETKELFASIEGQFGGIGVLISQDPTSMLMTFSNVYEEGAGAEAGFQNGDVLYKVDGEDVTGQSLDQVVTKIRGEEGSKVEITVLRGEGLEEYTATAVRKIVEADTVQAKMLDDQIGYIRITEFDTVTKDEFEQELKSIRDQKAKGLVIDLRRNPGGSMDVVCEMLDLILPEGKIVSTKDKNGKGEVFTSDEEHKLDIPLSVLVDGYSASAAEIFAGAVQDHGIGTLVGTKTFGKGIVQQIIPLSDDTCVKLTISEYFTPKGRNIHGKGIEPDVKVEYQYDENHPEDDNQLNAAVESVLKKIEE